MILLDLKNNYVERLNIFDNKMFQCASNQFERPTIILMIQTKLFLLL